jgi:hypothetical protein
MAGDGAAYLISRRMRGVHADDHDDRADDQQYDSNDALRTHDWLLCSGTRVLNYVVYCCRAQWVGKSGVSLWTGQEFPYQARFLRKKREIVFKGIILDDVINQQELPWD